MIASGCGTKPTYRHLGEPSKVPQILVCTRITEELVTVPVIKLESYYTKLGLETEIMYLNTPDDAKVLEIAWNLAPCTCLSNLYFPEWLTTNKVAL